MSSDSNVPDPSSQGDPAPSHESDSAESVEINGTASVRRNSAPNDQGDSSEPVTSVGDGSTSTIQNSAAASSQNARPLPFHGDVTPVESRSASEQSSYMSSMDNDAAASDQNDDTTSDQSTRRARKQSRSVPILRDGPARRVQSCPAPSIRSAIAPSIRTGDTPSPDGSSIAPLPSSGSSSGPSTKPPSEPSSIRNRYAPVPSMSGSSTTGSSRPLYYPLPPEDEYLSELPLQYTFPIRTPLAGKYVAPPPVTPLYMQWGWWKESTLYVLSCKGCFEDEGCCAKNGCWDSWEWRCFLSCCCPICEFCHILFEMGNARANLEGQGGVVPCINGKDGVTMVRKRSRCRICRCRICRCSY